MRYTYASTNWHFEPPVTLGEGDALDNHLVELFSAEYAIGELNMRARQNPRLVNYDTLTARRFKYWLDNFKSHAMELATEVTPFILKSFESWLSDHTTSGFANMVLNDSSGEVQGDYDPLYDDYDEGYDPSMIKRDGTMVVGFPPSQAFQFNIIEPVVRLFCQTYPGFVNTFITEEDISRKEDGIEGQLSDLSLEDQIEHIQEFVLMTAEYDWPGLKKWLKNFGDVDQVVRQVVTNTQPQWKEHWGEGVMDRAERDVQAAHDGLGQALEAGELGPLLSAINIALNTQHVHGDMTSRMEVSIAILNQLSNLDTDHIDEYLDENVTGPNWKQAKWEGLLENATKLASVGVGAFLRHNAKLAAYSFMELGHLEPKLDRNEEFVRAIRLQRIEIERYRNDLSEERGEEVSLNEATALWIPKFAEEWRELYMRAKFRRLTGCGGGKVKTASYDMKPVPENILMLEKTIELPDVDRYTTDDYAINFCLQETVARYSIGVYVTNYKVGISGYQQYWHFPLNKKNEALRTFGRIEDVIKETVSEMKYNSIPHSLIKAFLRHRLDPVDTPHKERTGVFHYNRYLIDVENAEDWRETIYGPRYPQPLIESLSEGTDIMNEDEFSREVVSSGNSRNKTYRFKYDYGENNPIKPNSPKRRSKNIPPHQPPSFESKQTDVFAKKKFTSKWQYKFASRQKWWKPEYKAVDVESPGGAYTTDPNPEFPNLSALDMHPWLAKFVRIPVTRNFDSVQNLKLSPEQQQILFDLHEPTAVAPRLAANKNISPEMQMHFATGKEGERARLYVLENPNITPEAQLRIFRPERSDPTDPSTKLNIAAKMVVADSDNWRSGFDLHPETQLRLVDLLWNKTLREEDKSSILNWVDGGLSSMSLEDEQMNPQVAHRFLKLLLSPKSDGPITNYTEYSQLLRVLSEFPGLLPEDMQTLIGLSTRLDSDGVSNILPNIVRRKDLPPEIQKACIDKALEMSLDVDAGKIALLAMAGRKDLLPETMQRLATDRQVNNLAYGVRPGLADNETVPDEIQLLLIENDVRSVGDILSKKHISEAVQMALLQQIETLTAEHWGGPITSHLAANPSLTPGVQKYIMGRMNEHLKGTPSKLIARFPFGSLLANPSLLPEYQMSFARGPNEEWTTDLAKNQNLDPEAQKILFERTIKSDGSLAARRNILGYLAANQNITPETATSLMNLIKNRPTTENPHAWGGIKYDYNFEMSLETQLENNKTIRQYPEVFGGMMKDNPEPVYYSPMMGSHKLFSDPDYIELSKLRKMRPTEPKWKQTHNNNIGKLTGLLKKRYRLDEIPIRETLEQEMLESRDETRAFRPAEETWPARAGQNFRENEEETVIALYWDREMYKSIAQDPLLAKFVAHSPQYAHFVDVTNPIGWALVYKDPENPETWVINQIQSDLMAEFQNFKRDLQGKESPKIDTKELSIQLTANNRAGYIDVLQQPDMQEILFKLLNNPGLMNELPPANTREEAEAGIQNIQNTGQELLNEGLIQKVEGRQHLNDLSTEQLSYIESKLGWLIGGWQNIVYHQVWLKAKAEGVKHLYMNTSKTVGGGLSEGAKKVMYENFPKSWGFKKQDANLRTEDMDLNGEPKIETFWYRQASNIWHYKDAKSGPLIVYHGTVAGRAIMAEGFKTSKELGEDGGQAALGGSDFRGSISFTTDYHVAVGVHRGLVMMHEFANAPDPVAKAREFMVDAPPGMLDSMNKAYGTDRGVEWGLQGKTVGRWSDKIEGFNGTTEELQQRGFDPMPDTPEGVEGRHYYWLRPMTPEEQDRFIYTFVKYYLFLHPDIYDPLFFGSDISNFRNIDRQDIGIVSVELNIDPNMRKDRGNTDGEGFDYLTGMGEIQIKDKSMIKRIIDFDNSPGPEPRVSAEPVAYHQDEAIEGKLNAILPVLYKHYEALQSVFADPTSVIMLFRQAKDEWALADVAKAVRKRLDHIMFSDAARYKKWFEMDEETAAGYATLDPDVQQSIWDAKNHEEVEDIVWSLMDKEDQYDLFYKNMQQAGLQNPDTFLKMISEWKQNQVDYLPRYEKELENAKKWVPYITDENILALDEVGKVFSQVFPSGRHASVMSRSEAKNILNKVVSELCPEINSLSPLARNMLWKQVAPRLKEHGLDSSWLGFLQSVFDSWGLSAFATTSRKWKIAYSVL